MENKDGQGQEKPSESSGEQKGPESTEGEVIQGAGSPESTTEPKEGDEVKNGNGKETNSNNGSSNSGSEKDTHSAGQGGEAESGGRGDDRGPGSVNQPIKLPVRTEGNDRQADGAGENAVPGGEQQGQPNQAEGTGKRKFWGYTAKFGGRRRAAKENVKV